MTDRIAGLDSVKVPDKELQVFKKEVEFLTELNNNKPFDPNHSVPSEGGLEWKLGDRSTLTYSLDSNVKDPAGAGHTENPGYMWEINLVLAAGKKIVKKDRMLQALLTQLKLEMGKLKTAAFTASLDRIADELEQTGNLRLALALDQISDKLEGH